MSRIRYFHHSDLSSRRTLPLPFIYRHRRLHLIKEFSSALLQNGQSRFQFTILGRVFRFRSQQPFTVSASECQVWHSPLKLLRSPLWRAPLQISSSLRRLMANGLRTWCSRYHLSRCHALSPSLSVSVSGTLPRSTHSTGSITATTLPRAFHKFLLVPCGSATAGLAKASLPGTKFLTAPPA